MTGILGEGKLKLSDRGSTSPSKRSLLKWEHELALFSSRAWLMIRAAQIPGPGQYDTLKGVWDKGGTWGKYTPKSDVQILMEIS